MFKFLDNFMERHKKDLGLYLIIITFLLVIIGCIFVYSSSSIQALLDTGNVNFYFTKQLMFAGIGIVGMLILCCLNTKIYRKYFPILYGGILTLLILVHFVGVGADEVGAKSWIRFFGIGLQPSELGKIAVIMAFSLFLEKDYFNFKKDKNRAFISLFITFLPIILVLTEPDMGTVAIMSASVVAILFFTNIPLKFFVVMGVSGATVLSLFMKFRAYRMARIDAWLNPFNDPQGISYQIVQSFYAIANGGIFGAGIGNSKQKFLWLPEQHTDFIFSIISEESGFIGISILIILILSLFVTTLYMSKYKDSLFQKYSIIGLGFVITFQSLLNIMVTTGLFPVTGVTLPFISYGGSSIVISCLMIGIIFSLYYDYN